MKRKRILYCSIGLLFCGLITTLFTYNSHSIASNVSLISIFLGTAGSILSLFIPTQFEKIIHENDWKNVSGDLTYIIQYREHGIKTPKATFFLKTDSGYTAVEIYFSFEKNDVIAKVGRRCTGKIIVH
ncbi:hypothetical protein EGI16_05460 [Chryseobacterium sp. G0240]|uniref:hypothetical protein n=1 Tax=Chryseobacterium sp. G0240 TaxID=2487066 RepID=UPI000F459524|nr:hypothetical protein [Chryseobacterium sp. G0240]ROI05828.1 hypothetical protein EGI16_05460 [Chryseobacterium sp. G0240]